MQNYALKKGMGWRCQPKKIPLIMKVVIIIISVFLLQSSAVFAQQLTYQKKQASLEEVFKEIRKQTGFNVFYSDNKINDQQKLDVDFKNAGIKTVLEKCLPPFSLEYTIDHKNIIIKAKPAKGTTSLADTNIVNIHATVTNELRIPLAGVTVRARYKAFSAMVVTNDGGEFHLDVDKRASIIFSYVGYVTREIQLVPSTAEMLKLIQLEPDNAKLDEVQVIAYGVTTKRLTTGNISTVTADEIARQPAANILQALQGRVPGLALTQLTGYMSGNYNVTIRGANNLPVSKGNNLPLGRVVSDPLFVVDGIPLTIGSNDPNGYGMDQNGLLGPAEGQSPLAWINPSDIESISVLKDADATAIYGSRAANGVVLITTKAPKTGKAQLDVSTYTGLSLQTKKLPLLNTTQYLAMRREAFKNDGVEPDADMAYDLLSWDNNRYTDWQKKLLNTATTNDLQLGLTGGNLATSFRINGSYHRETPPFPGKFAEDRITTALTLNHSEFNQKLKFSLMVNLSGNNSNLPQSDPTSLIFLAPNAPQLYNAAGKLNYAEYLTGQFPAQIAALERPYRSDTKNLASNLNINYTVIEGLKISIAAGYNLGIQNQTQLIPGASQDPLGTINRQAIFGDNNVKTWLVEPTVNWSYSLKAGTIEAMAGATFQNSVVDGNLITGNGYLSDQLLESRAAAATFNNAVSNYAQTKVQSVFARLSYNLYNKYIVTVNARRDGSSRFGPGNQFGNFGSLGAAWIFSEEEAVKKFLPMLSFGKLRGSYGITGGDALGDYSYLSLLGIGYNTYQGQPVFVPTQAANPNYKWTVNKKLDISVDLGFLNDRLTLSASFYRNRSGNQLVNYPLVAITGYPSVVNNLGASVQNKGWEFSLSSRNIAGKAFSWTTAANFSMTRNKLLAFPGLETSSYVNVFTIGQPISRTELFHYTGMDPATGHYMIADKDNDGVISYQKDQNYYNSMPSFTGGIDNNLQFGNFSLQFFFVFTKQMGMENTFNINPGAPNTNQTTAVLNRWQKPGDQAAITGFSNFYREDIDYFLQSDALWVNASYVRLQNASLSYRISGLKGKTKYFPNTTISLQGQNLVTFSPYKGTDPANPTTALVLPPRRIVSAKVQFIF